MFHTFSATVEPRLSDPAPPESRSARSLRPAGLRHPSGAILHFRIVSTLGAQSMDKFIAANGLRLHCIDHSGGEPSIILLPGLTANANNFDGLVAAGLSPRFRVLAVDLRGRGQSSKPDTGYSIPDHAADVIGLMNELGITKAVLGGHSFGGMLAMYIASRFPEPVQKLLVLDSAAGLIGPETRDMIKPSVGRLGNRFPSWH